MLLGEFIWNPRNFDDLRPQISPENGDPQVPAVDFGGCRSSPSTNPFRNFLQLMKTSWNPSKPIEMALLNVGRDSPSAICFKGCQGCILHCYDLGKKIPTLADIYHLKPHMEGILIVIFISETSIPTQIICSRRTSSRLLSQIASAGEIHDLRTGHVFPLKNSSWKMTFL